MNPQPISITLSGASYGEVIAAAASLVNDARATTAPKVSTTARKPVATAAAVELDEELEETETESFDDAELEEDEETTVVATKKKAAKLTDKDVNAAAMAHAKRHGGKAKTLALLAKKFKVKSVLELKPEQYAAVVAALQG